MHGIILLKWEIWKSFLYHYFSILLSGWIFFNIKNLITDSFFPNLCLLFFYRTAVQTLLV